MVTLPKEYPLVIGVSLLACGHSWFEGLRVGLSRKKIFNKDYMSKHFMDIHRKSFGIAIPMGGYPDMGSGVYSTELDYKSWWQFNANQRVHQNYIENLCMAVLSTLSAGIYQPRIAAGVGLFYIFSRLTSLRPFLSRSQESQVAIHGQRHVLSRYINQYRRVSVQRHQKFTMIGCLSVRQVIALKPLNNAMSPVGFSYCRLRSNRVVVMEFLDCSLPFILHQALENLRFMSQGLVGAPVAIDLGSWTSKIAVVKKGLVQVITNEANFRETPCVVGYGPAERNIGEAGNIKIKTNFRDTITAPMRFLGLYPGSPLLRNETKYCPARLNNNKGRLRFDVNYQGQKEEVLPEQAMAAYFNKLKQIVVRNGFQCREVVISVPAYMSQHERQALLDSARIADLNVARLINDSTAVALDYGLFRKADLHPTEPRNVLFVDFGHSKSSLFLCSFSHAEMNVLEEEYCRHLGCRNIDSLMFEFYRQQFEKQSKGLDVSQNRKAVIKLMESIERQRKILTGNSQNELNIEYLMEENDLRYNMTRGEFETIIQPALAQFGQALQRMKQTILQNKINLHSIELVGSGSRIPAFVGLVKEVFGIEPLRTLNSSESCARGCALMAAIKSPLLRVSTFSINERVSSAVRFKYSFVEGGNLLGLRSELYPEKNSKIIYEVGAKAPNSKTVKLARKEAIQVLLQYDSPPPGIPKLIAYYLTQPLSPKEETFSISFKIKHNENGMITFEDCNMIEEWHEEQRIPKKKEIKKEDPPKAETAPAPDQGAVPPPQPVPTPTPMEEEFEIKKSKKERSMNVKFEQNTFPANTEKEIQHMFSLECTMLNQDRIIVETYERKNELESAIYSCKEKINNDHSEFVKPEEAKNILACAESQKNWLQNEGQNANRSEYAQRIEQIKAIYSPVAKRYVHFHDLQDAVKMLMDAIRINSELLQSPDPKYQHITLEERAEVAQFINRVLTWINQANQAQLQRPKNEDVVITVQEVQNNLKEIREKTTKLMSKPVPKAPEPKPAQAPAPAAGQQPNNPSPPPSGPTQADMETEN